MSILNGFSQIMLQRHQLTGLLFVVGIFLGDWLAGFAAIVGALVGYLTAKLLRFPTQNIEDGLYSFSAILFSIALLISFGNTPLTWAFIVVGSTLAAFIQHLFIIKKLPGFTFPFIVATWIFLFFGKSIIVEGSSSMTSVEILASGIRGYGQIIFQSSLLSGALFFIGVLISSPIAGLAGIAAAFLGTGVALILNMPIDDIALGLFGFNAVLTAIAFSGEEKKKWLWISLGVIITIVIDIFFRKTGILNFLGGAFTFPFVLGSWVTLSFKYMLRSSNGKS